MPYQLYIGDDWHFDLIATDGTNGVGGITKLVGGSGFTTAPTVTFGPGPISGRTATGTAVIADGSITGVTITDPGLYNPGKPPLMSFSGGGGIGANAIAVLGNPVDLSAYTLGAELFTTLTGPSLDLTLVANGAVTRGAAKGAFSIDVNRILTATTVPTSPNSIVFPTRVHAFYSDANGRKHTIGVISILPQIP